MTETETETARPRAAADLPRPVMLYDVSTAPNPRRVRMFLAEKGVEIPSRQIDIVAREHYEAPYRALAGTHRVPALELSDGTVLTETVAICRYIEALHPDPPLMGIDPLDAAIVEMWSRRAEFEFAWPVAFVARHTNPKMRVLETEQVPEWGESNKGRMLEGLAMLDRRLREVPFLAGPRFTIADITAFTAIEFMRVTRIPVPEEMTAVPRWREAMRARPSAAA